MTKLSGFHFLSVTPKLVLFVTAALVSTVGSVAHADDSVFHEAEKCNFDPLCVEKDAPAAKPTVKPKKDLGKEAAELAAQQARKKRSDDEGVRHGAPVIKKQAASAAPISASNIRANYTNKTTRTGYEYDFEEDGIDGSGISANQITVRRKIKAAVPCFDAYWAGFSDPHSTASHLKAQYATMQKCFDSCITQEDANFLAGCVDWNKVVSERAKIEAGDTDLSYAESDLHLQFGDEPSTKLGCTQSQLDAGKASGAYQGSHTTSVDWTLDPETKLSVEKNRVCGAPPAPPTIPAPVQPHETVREFGKRVAQVVRETHECPKTREDYAKLKDYAVSLIAMGRKTTSIPVISGDGKVPVSCGYSPKHDEFFRRAFHCTDSNTCFDQMRESYAMDCTRFTRRNGNDRYFYEQGSDCIGLQSYHNDPGASKSRGDLILLPIEDGVWLQGYRGGMGFTDLNYVGLVFGASAAVQ